MEYFSFLATLKKETFQWPRMEQSIPKLTLVWKSKGLMIGTMKWQKIHKCQLWAPSNVLKNQISAKHHGLRPSIQAWEMIAHNPAARQRERERERRTIGSVVIKWRSASPTTGITRHRSHIKLKCIGNVCSSWGTLLERVTCNPSFYHICKLTQLQTWRTDSGQELEKGEARRCGYKGGVLESLVMSVQLCILMLVVVTQSCICDKDA